MKARIKNKRWNRLAHRALKRQGSRRPRAQYTEAVREYRHSVMLYGA